MSSWARVGVKCVCKDIDGIDVYGAAPYPSIGAVYTISRVEVYRGNLEVELVELPPPDDAGNWYLLSHFRPLHTLESDAEMFRALVDGMGPLERLDRLGELLDTTPSP